MATLIVAVMFFAVALPFATRDDFDDFIEVLNALIVQEGPVPGSIAEDIPEAEANAQMAAVGNALSNGRINTQDPENANQFAFE